VRLDLARLLIADELAQNRAPRTACRTAEFLSSTAARKNAPLCAAKASEAALEVLREAPDAQTHAPPVITESNWALLDSRRYDDARKGVAEGLRLSWTPDLMLQDGLLKIEAKEYAAAGRTLDGLLRQSPEDLRVLTAMVQLYGRQNQEPAALRAVRAHTRRAIRIPLLFRIIWASCCSLMENPPLPGPPSRAPWRPIRISGPRNWHWRGWM
jgi:hypothetical protein